MRTPLTLQLTTFALTPHPHQITDIVLDKGGDWFNKGGDLAAVCVTPPHPHRPAPTPTYAHRTYTARTHPHVILILSSRWVSHPYLHPARPQPYLFTRTSLSPSPSPAPDPEPVARAAWASA